ncbi:MAG: cyclic nucleotide-binding domain-containing protein [Myxococcota bacterium]
MNKAEVLQKSRLFENLLPEEIEMLAELSVMRRYKGGEVVFEKGDVGDSLFMVVEGDVEVLLRDGSGEPKVLATLGIHDFFGEMSLIDKEYRSATVRAKSDCALLLLTHENLHAFSKAFREGFTWITVNIARVLSQRLRETNRRLAEKL